MRGYSCVGLHMAKNAINVGSALRAARAFGASMVAITGRRYTKGRGVTDTTGAIRHLPLIQCTDLRDVIPYDCVPVAVDLIEGATPLASYMHPERAFYVFGPEDGTLGQLITRWCRDKIFLPTRGCLNLAACVNVVLYDRAAKRAEWPQ